MFNMLGANLKFLRKLKGLSQQDLAKALSLPRTTLGDYERSHTEPNLLMLKKISKYFDVSLDQLIRGKLNKSNVNIGRGDDL
jgi:transcriptional regulator with XRE-family HTH domain